MTWFKIVERVLWYVPYPIAQFEAFRVGQSIGTEIRLLGVVVARGGYR